jgi:hypothetical protein
MVSGYGVWLVGLVRSSEARNNRPSLTTSLPPTTSHFTPQGYGLCIYANHKTKTFVGDYQQVMGGLEKLSPKNLHMSNPNITFTPSII